MSAQHKEELDLSNLKAELFDKKAGGLFTSYDKQIDIIDIHKLRDESGDKTVAVESFESNNLVLVDEGHRGSSGVEWKEKEIKYVKTVFPSVFCDLWSSYKICEKERTGAGICKIYPF